MESNLNQDGMSRPSYVFSADPLARPSEINFDGIKLDLSREFSLVASGTEANSSESKDYLQVCLRVRPFTQTEKEHESEGCVYILDSQTVLLKEPQCTLGRLSEKSSGQMAQKFSFSKVFGPETTQKEFFEGCILQPVKDLLKGQSRLIFTYGLTNSGKTYTFQGTEENTGILPRTLNVLFDSLQERLYTKMNLKPHRSREYLRLSPDQEKEEVASKSALLRQIKEVVMHNDSYGALYGRITNSLSIPEFEESMKDCEHSNLNMDINRKFSVWVSFFEIYNECIYDLFVPVSSKFQKRKTLRLSQDVKGYSFIKDLQWIQVSDAKEAYRLLKLGTKHQSVAFTKLNNASSRSHSIFTIRILQIEDSEIPHVIRVSELSLCDLAGSERSMRTQNEGERLRETGNINSSLLTLGKCISVLKNSEKSKFQQHVPFRESKLTHYFQSFFNGKGKICMIVNISQCSFAYDETLNVLKFSAIAQKVCVPDILNCSQEKSFGSVKSQDESLDINNSDNKILNEKRSTISWESSLEDVVEDEDLVEDLEEAEEKQNVETEFTNEDLDNTLEDDKAFSSHEGKRKLLDLIENLKKKLINERKEKLTLEFKIREEVTQEFTQYLAQREADFKETLLQEREILEENAECRLAIFKDLIGKCDAQEESKNEDHALKDETEEAIGCLEIKFNQVKAELAKTKEELIKTQEELKKRESESEINLNSLVQELEKSNKKIIMQNQRIQELMDKIDQKEDTIMENTCKGSDNVGNSSLIINNKLVCNEMTEMSKDSKTKTYSGRKRLNETELQQDEPPAKKGLTHASPTITEDQKKSEETQESISDEENIRVLQENNEELKTRLLTIENELKNEKEEKTELNKQIVSLQQELSSSEKKCLGFSIEVQQIQSSYDNVISELHVQKSINQEQKERIMKLSEEIETARRNITNNVSQIKLMQAKIDELRRLDSVSQIASIDLLNFRDFSSCSQEGNLPNTQLRHLDNDYLISKQVKEHGIQELSRERSFHSTVEAIWEECKEIVKTSSQKTHQIEELEKQIEKLQAEVKDYTNENNRLKIEEREKKNQDDLLKEKDNLIQQLKKEVQEKTISLDIEVQHVVEGKRALLELTQDVTSYKEKIKELEAMLETQKDECSHSAKLEQEIMEKESVILKQERNLNECQANLKDSIQNARDLSEREVKLKEEIMQLTKNLQDAKHSLQLKEEEKETNWQETEKLKEELSASTALVQNLKADLQRKEEDYAELKEKLADAKKQIEQVQKEVSVMRDEEKLLRIKINELEKKKNQCSQEIDMKQRTIQQLKEQLNNQKVEEAMQQYERVCKDLSVKEKIIKDMQMTLEEQEQTQVEQDQVLEAKLEETERLARELEEWKEKCKDLEAKHSQSSNKEFEDNTDVLNIKLTKLQDELQESEQKHEAERKKWLEEKMMLITQAKEAESLRNKEMKKYAEDREHCLKQQNAVEILKGQLAEKDGNLQQWREERDQLVAALEIQLKALISSNAQKDNEIEQLRKVTSEASKTEKQTMDIQPTQMSSTDPGKVGTEPQSTSFEISRGEVEDGSVVLDSCEVSTENNQSTRFPKPELEIQFTPLQPNRMAVKHPGCTSPVTVKIPKARKRKSHEMEEDFVKFENKKNATPRINLKSPVSGHRNSSVKKEQKVSMRPSCKKTYSLRSHASTSDVNGPAKKKEGTLQKFGDFLQHSPIILQSKAKKIIETMSSSKFSNVEVSKDNVSRPKRAKRKLYTNEISSPIDISGQVILMDHKVKESDHQILKRRLHLHGGDLHSALDWLCLNLSDDALPEGFSQEFEEQQPKSRPKFQYPQTQATISPPLQPKTRKQEEDPKIMPKKDGKNLEVNMKEWILRYAEQQNEEKSETSKSLEEEKFDPNERYLHLAAKLLDAKEQAATFKLEKNKQGQKETQEKIRKFQREMETLEDHPVFNPAIKISHQQNERKKPPVVTEGESALNFNLFEKSTAAPEEEREKKKEPHDVRNFDYTARSWTGKSPKQFLIDWVRKNLPKSPNPSFEKVAVGRYWKCRVRVIKSEDDVLVVCPTILTEDGMQAQHLGATLALYRLVKGQSVHQLLPPTYRDVWLEWSDAEKKKEELNKMETNKPRDLFIAKLLNKLKQQQQQQQQHSENKRENSEDPEESWENLVSDEDFSALSLESEKVEDLEPVRNLFRKLQSTPKYQRLLKERQQLPVFKHRSSIVETLKRHRVVVVAGETGSGKSTQVPHFLLEDLLLNEWGATKCNIVCTQPRRISAVSLATRVCDELGCENGPGGKNSLCGYQIRMESRASESTRLLYCTTGVLLRKLQEDGLLTNVSHVIVDEVHERSVQSDFLLIILKEILQKRSDLHLILMSATVDSEKFSTYFTHCPILRISGRSYPVEVFHLEDIIEETGFVLEKDSEYCQKFLEEEEEITINVTTKAGGIKKYQEYIPVQTGTSADLNPFYQKYSSRTQHAILYMNPHKINLDLVLELLIYLDRSPQFKNVEGAVLIFLPGLAHIQQLYDLLSTDRRFFSERYKVIALHSILSTQDQAAAFTLPPQGVRKIVLATNIAETGITIPDVVFVIDTGRTKENKYHESSQMSSLVETFVSKASALQRQGRAGRVRDGFCFRMYTRERFEGFMDYSVPEILRVPLEELCLHIMKCNLGSPEDFLSKALDPPQLQVISNAMNLLRKIGACELNEPKLTPLGQHLAALPVNVKIGKMLIFGAIFGCLDPVATLAAVMTEKSPFTTPIGRKDEADLAKSALAMADSDHLTIYNAYLGWKKARQEGGYRSEIAYCRKNFLNRTSLLTLEDVKQELIKLVKAAGFLSSTTSNSFEGNRATQTLSFQEIALLKAVLTAGLYDNVGKIMYTKSVDITEKLACIVETAQGKAQVHPSSVNRDLQIYGWLLYQEKIRYARVYLRETTLITPFPVLLFGGDIEVQHRERLISVDGWIYFQAPVKIAVIFKQLRVLIDSVLRKKLENPKMSLENDKILQIITELIKTE